MGHVANFPLSSLTLFACFLYFVLDLVPNLSLSISLSMFTLSSWARDVGVVGCDTNDLGPREEYRPGRECGLRLRYKCH